jgi:hypothetical protein
MQRHNARDPLCFMSKSSPETTCRCSMKYDSSDAPTRSQVHTRLLQTSMERAVHTHIILQNCSLCDSVCFGVARASRQGIRAEPILAQECGRNFPCGAVLVLWRSLSSPYVHSGRHMVVRVNVRRH